jgi:hypothetical protein
VGPIPGNQVGPIGGNRAGTQCVHFCGMNKTGVQAGESSQRAFLIEAKRRLGERHPKLTWNGLAELVGMEPRALKTYLMPEDSPNFRSMPNVARVAIEKLVAATKSSDPIEHEVVGEPSNATTFEALMPSALAALVVRQARQALVHGRHISGVERYPGDSIGLERADRHAMALVSRACLQAGLTDVGAEIHDLLHHCTRPLSSWLPLPFIYRERLSDVVLLSAEEGAPTREAEELAQQFGGSDTATLEELLFGRFRELLQKNSATMAAAYYSRVREFVVRHPVVTAQELSELAADLPSAIHVLITQHFYETVPDGWGQDGQLSTCAHCGNAVVYGPQGQICRTRACAETLPLMPGRRIALRDALRLARGIRHYWQEPGFDELGLFDELKRQGLSPVLYPELDRVDIEVGDVGIDLKAYISPELLASRIRRNIGGLAFYKNKWLVIPDRLVERVPAYLERLRSALKDSPVRVLTVKTAAKELERA